MTERTSSPLVCYDPRVVEPWVRVICFPHAGGGPHSFAHLRNLPEWMEVHVVSYAGRGARYAEPFAEDFESISREAFSSIREFAERPLLLVGHSFGALLAFDVTTKLEQETNAMTLGLVVSSCPEPSMRIKNEKLSQMTDAALLTALASRDWLPAAVSGGGAAGLVAHTLPPLRADLALYEQYEITNEVCVRCAITITGGTLDASVPLEKLTPWKQRSLQSANCQLKLVPNAGHFHIESHAADFTELLEQSAQALLDASSAAVICGPKYDPVESTIYDLIHMQSKIIPNAPAVFEPFSHSPPAPALNAQLTSERGATTFKSLITTVNTVAAVLIHEFNVKPGNIVAVYHEPSTAYILANLAIFAAGAAMVYFEVNYTASLIEQLLIASQAVSILTNARLRAKTLTALLSPESQNKHDTLVKLHCLELNNQRNEFGGISWLFLDEEPCLSYCKKNQDAAIPNQLSPKLSSLAYCSMSSGTTGRPKAILVEHHSVTHNFHVREAVCPYVSENDRDGCNVFFVWESLRAPSKGRVTVIIPDDVIVDARSLASFLRVQKITRCMLTPSLLRNLLDQPGLDAKRVLGHLRYVLLEGEVVPHQLVQDFKRLFHSQSGLKEFPVLINYYSTWESLDATSALLAPTHITKQQKNSPFQKARFAAPVGLPLPGVCMLIIDRRTRQVLPRGVPGFVLVVASSIARGYLGDDEKTKDRFSTNPVPALAEKDAAVRHALEENSNSSEISWVADTNDTTIRCYDTGDRGLVTTQGELFLLGRADATVKLRGFKIALNYVEATTLELGSVRACVVRPVINQETQQPEGIVAYVVPREELNGNYQIFISAIHAHHKTTLPEYAVPAYLIPLDKLPTKPGSGKLDFANLPHPTDADRPGNWTDQAAKTTEAKAGISTDEVKDFDKGSSGSARVAARVIAEAFRETLGRQEVANDANFFELGGHSLHAAKIIGFIAGKLGVELKVVELFERPTINALALLISSKLGGDEGNADTTDALALHPILAETEIKPMLIAVTGAAGLFPGAPDVRSFWSQVLESCDSLTTLSFAELAERGVPEHVLCRPDFVPKAQKLNGTDVVSFDALFWGISAAEARIMDPQHRKLLEVAWRARETAGRGIRANQNNDAYGVFASAGIDGYMIHHLSGSPLKDIQDPAQIFLGEVGSEKDYACTRISYQCGLRGPSISVNSACSSALVAAVLAMNAINNQECIGAIVGATSITFPNLGYIYVDGLVGSEDGVVRPLDAAASGTLFGDSVGAICLEALSLSNESSQHEHEDRAGLALILSGATTNDGRLKAGYTAPSAEAQALAIARSIQRSKIPRLDFVELHATATKLGDAIELAGLGRALGLTKLKTNDKNAVSSLILGSIKGNIGHANCAAGFTGLLKVCLSLAHGLVPATAHFTKLNPRITLPLNSIIVPHGHRPAKLEQNGRYEDGPSFAGVSSFGVGGTNAHLTLCSPLQQNDAVRNGGGYYGDLQREFHSRTLAPPKFISWDSDDFDRPHGAAARSADIEDAAAAATYAAMRDAAAAAAIDFGVDPTSARREALEAVRQIDFKEGNNIGKGPTLQMIPESRFSRTLDQSGRVNSLDTLVGIVGPDGLTLTEATSRISKISEDETKLSQKRESDDRPNNNIIWDQYSDLDGSITEIQQERRQKFKRKPRRRRAELIILSARTKESLSEQRDSIAAFMQRCEDEDTDVYLQDVAKTLQEGREHWSDWRLAISARTLGEAAKKLRDAELIPRAKKRSDNMDVICLQLGDAYPKCELKLGAGRALFETHAEFRSQVQACASIIDAPLRELPPINGSRAPNGLLEALGYLVDEVDLEPGSTFALHGRSSLLATQAILNRPAVAQPVTFALLYSLAACLFGVDDVHSENLGIKCTLISQVRFFAAIAGYGIGQLVALALDGSVKLDNALLFCLERGRLIEEASPDAGDRFESFLMTKFKNEPEWLHAPRRTAVADNVSGQWLNAFDAADPGYWREHFEKEMNNDLKWDANFQALDRWDPAIIISIDTACRNGCAFTLENGRSVCSIGNADDSDVYSLTYALAAVWLTGVVVDWPAARLSARGRNSRGRKARFIAGVPGYAFAKTSFWINPRASVYADIPSDDTNSITKNSTASRKQTQLSFVTPVCLVNKSSRNQKGSFTHARVICAAYAGGSSSSFTQWVTAAPNWLQILAIESPGRGARADESSLSCDDDDGRELTSLCNAILDVTCRDRVPWALLGLSAGGLQVVEIYNELLRRSNIDRRAERALTRLTCIFVAGRAPPDPVLAEPGALNKPLPSDEEIASVYALADDATRQSEAYRTVALPRLKSDLATDARAERRVAILLKERAFDKIAFSPTIVVAGGIDDPSFSPTNLGLWRALAGTSVTFECKFYSGGHDFLVTHHKELLTDLTSHLSQFGFIESMIEDKISAAPDLKDPLYSVRWEDVGIIDPPSLDVDKETYVEMLPTTRLCDLRRNALLENDPEILDETAADALRRGVLIIDGLDTTIDDNKGNTHDQNELDWIRRDEEEAWCLVEVLRRIAENTSGRVDATIISRASPHGALAAGASKCVRYEIGLFSLRRVYVRIDALSVSQLGLSRDAFVRWAVDAGRQASASLGDEDVLLWPVGSIENATTWRAAVLRAKVKAVDTNSDAPVASIVANRTVLVTGATGGLGKVLVEWLQGMGADVIKLGRRLPPGEDASKFAVAAVDDFDSLASNPVLSRCDRIALIFHLAGMLSDATIVNMNQSTFCAPIVPKAHGLVAIRKLAAKRNWGTKCIVAYSSTTSLYGFGGQTNYAAANAFLDAFADFSDDLLPLAGAPPVLAIHWGPWAEAGMAAVGTKANDHALRVGDKPLSTAEALRCLGKILDSGLTSARYAIFKVDDWSKSPWKSLAAVRHLVEISNDETNMDLSKTETTTTSPRKLDAVDEFLRHRVSQWLPDETLDSLGLDSLDLAQMRAQAADIVGITVPMSLFTAPDRTLGELADALRDFIETHNTALT